MNFPNKVLLLPCSPSAKDMVPSGPQKCAKWLLHALNVFLLRVSSHPFLCDYFSCRSSRRELASNLLPCYTELVPAQIPDPPQRMIWYQEQQTQSGRLAHGSPGDFTE